MSQFGLWHRLTCDRGTENVLVMHFQNRLALQHEVPYVVDNPDRDSACVVPSTSDIRAEYQWRFLNQGVTRPMLTTLDVMFANHDFDLGDKVHKFCVAEAACIVANKLIDRLFGQLINRRIDRVGRPRQVMREQFNTMPLIPAHFQVSYIQQMLRHNAMHKVDRLFPRRVCLIHSTTGLSGKWIARRDWTLPMIWT